MQVEVLQRLINDTQADLAERELPIKLTILAVLSGEHILLLGPPGTAKSLIARRTCGLFEGFEYFEYLLTRFTVPEEVFGPLSLSALQNDRFERQINGYLPQAHLAFLDEVFKANSSILNALLTLINERIFHNGNQRIKTPLRTLVGASNEVPAEGEGLDALYDRFLFRVVLEPVRSADEFLNKVLRSPVFERPEQINREFLADIDANWPKVELLEDVEKGILRLRSRLQDMDVYVSDRRWKQAVKVLKVAAYASNRMVVDRFDALLLSHIVWSRPEDRVAIQRLVRSIFLGELQGDDRPEELARLSAKLIDLRDEISGVKAGRRGDCPHLRTCKNVLPDEDAIGKCANFIPDDQGGCLNFDDPTQSQRKWFAPAMTMSLYSPKDVEPQRWECRTQPCNKYKELLASIESLYTELTEDLATLDATVKDQSGKLPHLFVETTTGSGLEAELVRLKRTVEVATSLRDKARRIAFQLFGSIQ